MRLHLLVESCASRESWVDHLLTRQAMSLVRFFLAMLDVRCRSDVKVLLRSGQEVTLILSLHEVQARRQQRTLVERSSVESHATTGALERASRTLGEMLRAMKHTTEMRVGGRLPRCRRTLCFADDASSSCCAARLTIILKAFRAGVPACTSCLTSLGTSAATNMLFSRQFFMSSTNLPRAVLVPGREAVLGIRNSASCEHKR